MKNKRPYGKFTKVMFFITAVLLIWQVINFELSHGMKMALSKLIP